MAREGFFSWLTFSRMSPVLKLGHQRSLTEEDLESIDTEIDVEDLYDKFLQVYASTKSVSKTFYDLFRGEFWLGLFLYFLSPIALFCSPIVIGLMLDSLEQKATNPQLRWLWAVLFFGIQILSIFGQSMSDCILVRASLKARSIIVIAVFRLSVMQHAHQCVKGDYVNLMSQDSQRVVEFSVLIMRCLAAPVQVIAGITYGYFVIGWPIFVGLALMLVFVPVTALMGKKAHRLNHRKMKDTDYRITYVNEILQAIKVVKSGAWDEACLREINRRRELELRQLLRFRMLSSILVPFAISLPTIATVLVLIFKTLDSDSGESTKFTAANAFQVVTIFLTIRAPFVILPLGISLGSQVAASFQRLKAFLDLESRSLRTEQSVHSQEEVTYSWENIPSALPTTRKSFSLQMPRFECAPGSFVAVVGAVGAGKTALLRAILGEMAGSAPSVETIGYCAESPFIRFQTVKQNICGKSCDQDRYEHVLTSCQLRADLQQLPHGDQTEIGERGFNLSGGQKARIAIARAVYSQCDVLLFDDVLAALDKGVSTAILHDVLMVDTRTRIVVSMDIGVAKAADVTIFIEDGKAHPAAAFDELLASSEAFRDFAHHSGGASKTNDNKESAVPKSVTAILSQGSQLGTLVEKEKLARGIVPWSAYKAYITAASNNNCFIAFGILFLFLLTECGYVAVDTWVAKWSDNAFGFDDALYAQIYAGITGLYFLSMLVRSVCWVAFGFQAARTLHTRLMRGVLRSPLRFFETTPSGRILNRASKDIGDVDVMLADRWFYYAITITRVVSILITISFVSPVFLATVVPFLFLYYFMLNYYRRSSRELQRLVSTSLSPLFSAYTEAVQGLTTIRAFRSESILLDEFQTHLNHNIRSVYVFRMVELWFTLRISLVGAFVVLAAALGIAGLYNAQAESGVGLAGLAISFALNIVVNLSMSVRNFAQVEAQMSAVERILEYSQLPPEDEISMLALPDSDSVGHEDIALDVEKSPFCINKGAISMIDLSVSYREGLEPALRNLTISIAGGAFVGICGRTGAGKSTLFLALLRLVPWKGSILIDGVDIRSSPLSQLRKAITSVPQDPVLFSGTLRQNIDIFGVMQDADIHRALEDSHFTQLGGRGLDMDVAAGGTNWSAGEKQMICFARALLQKNKIILLDEATSSLDGATDQRIQATLRESLKDTTRLVIAHRLETIADADQVIVIERGQLQHDGGKEIIAYI